MVWVENSLPQKYFAAMQRLLKYQNTYFRYFYFKSRCLFIIIFNEIICKRFREIIYQLLLHFACIYYHPLTFAWRINELDLAWVGTNYFLQGYEYYGFNFLILSIVRTMTFSLQWRFCYTKLHNYAYHAMINRIGLHNLS